MWYGGKGNRVATLLPLIPTTQVYCEPYGGAASVLFHREPAPVEVYNDLDGNLVNLFRALQDPERCWRLHYRLLYTLFSFDEFRCALSTLADERASIDDRAWAFFVAMNQGFSGTARSAGNWSRAFVSDAGMAQTTNKWLMRLSMLPQWHQRLLRVQIDNRCALEVIRYWDSPQTTFYLDPPYVLSTRTYRQVYAVEQPDAHHEALIEQLTRAQGAIVLSGYAHPILNRLDEAGWDRTEIQTSCYAAGRTRASGLQGDGSVTRKVPRTEVIWRNSRAVSLTASAGVAQTIGLFGNPDE
jgi:DNA adenine methylase